MTSCEQELLKDQEAELLTKLKNHQPTDSTFKLSLWAFTCGFLKSKKKNEDISTIYILQLY